MQLNTYHQDLNLPEGASIADIKAAFRQMAKSYHPDAAGRTSADVEKFIKAQTAYQQLMKTAAAHNRARRATVAPAPPASSPAANWRFVSSREVGLDIYYRLYILKPEAAGAGCQVTLPWQAREACPRCLGQGRTLARLGQNSIYRPATCPRCQGQGTITRESRLEVSLTPEMVGRDKIRLRRAGLYHPSTAQRGDLILEPTWVSQLPRQN
ncbi:MAG: DnaJ domain-containing protein [Candidatus Adiutrix sp.]|nr:DnaJ domain-containing protein [Candidatus Adiutrix sp.]